MKFGIFFLQKRPLQVHGHVLSIFCPKNSVFTLRKNIRTEMIAQSHRRSSQKNVDNRKVKYTSDVCMATLPLTSTIFDRHESMENQYFSYSFLHKKNNPLLVQTIKRVTTLNIRVYRRVFQCCMNTRDGYFTM